MIKTFTKNDLVRFVYDEVNEDELDDINTSLCSDMDLRSSLDEIEEAKSLLDSFVIKAPSDLVSRILYTSKNALLA